MNGRATVLGVFKAYVVFLNTFTVFRSANRSRGKSIHSSGMTHKYLVTVEVKSIIH